MKTLALVRLSRVVKKSRIRKLKIYFIYIMYIKNCFQISGCLSEKSGGARINAMQMKDMNTGRGMPQLYDERQKESTVSTSKHEK